MEEERERQRKKNVSKHQSCKWRAHFSGIQYIECQTYLVFRHWQGSIIEIPTWKERLGALGKDSVSKCICGVEMLLSHSDDVQNSCWRHSHATKTKNIQSWDNQLFPITITIIHIIPWPLVGGTWLKAKRFMMVWAGDARVFRRCEFLDRSRTAMRAPAVVFLRDFYLSLSNLNLENINPGISRVFRALWHFGRTITCFKQIKNLRALLS